MKDSNKNGGNHEEGGVSYESNGKDVIARAKPGASGQPQSGAVVSIITSDAADPKLQMPAGTAPKTSWHVHPSGESPTPSERALAPGGATGMSLGGSTTVHTWTQPPSTTGPHPDTAAAFPAPTLNLVIGAGNSFVKPTVYVFDSTGPVCEESYKDFKK